MVALALVPFNDHLFKSNIEESTLNPLARAELEFNRAQIDAGRTAIITEESLTEVPVPADGPDTDRTDVSGRPDAEKPTGSDPVVSEKPVQQATAVSERPIEQASAVSERPVQQAPAVSQTPVRQSVSRPSQAVVVEEYRYLLIIGSFQGEDNALTMVERLRRQGFDPEVAGGPDGFLRVSAQSFPTLDEARVVLDRVRKEYTGAWVYKSRE
jgi:cell division protein FtsN